jgi:pullulanase
MKRYLFSLAVLALLTVIPATAMAQLSIPVGSVRIHFHRNNGDYAGWTIFDWAGAKNPSSSYQNPGTPPPVSDDFGVYWDIALADRATQLFFIVRNADGTVKNCPSDMVLDISKGLEIWLLQDDCTIYTTKPRTDLVGNIKAARAYWVNRDTLAWLGAEPTDIYQLFYSADAGITDVATSGVEGDGKSIPLTVDPSGLSQTIVDKFPFLKGATAFKIAQSQLGQVPSLLKDQLVLVKFNGAQPVDATSLQIPGVLDDLFYFDGRLGAHFTDSAVRFRLWAPTAQKVQLFVYDDPNGIVPTIYPMVQKDRGVWETKAGNYSWVNHKYYLYEVTVFSRATGRIVTNLVTDPYSFGLAADSVKSLVVDLNSPFTKPIFWNLFPKPPLASPTDIVLYELHIRDFSISDQSIPDKDRGKYTAFNHIFSPGMQHLRSLAKAGLTHVHLLPSFDFSSVPELASEQMTPDITIPISAPDSQQPQAAIAAVKDRDGFNWGYDPYHYGTPEGS